MCCLVDRSKHQQPLSLCLVALCCAHQDTSEQQHIPHTVIIYGYHPDLCSHDVLLPRFCHSRSHMREINRLQAGHVITRVTFPNTGSIQHVLLTLMQPNTHTCVRQNAAGVTAPPHQQDCHTCIKFWLSQNALRGRVERGSFIDQCVPCEKRNILYSVVACHGCATQPPASYLAGHGHAANQTSSGGALPCLKASCAQLKDVHGSLLGCWCCPATPAQQPSQNNKLPNTRGVLCNLPVSESTPLSLGVRAAGSQPAVTCLCPSSAHCGRPTGLVGDNGSVTVLLLLLPAMLQGLVHLAVPGVVASVVASVATAVRATVAAPVAAAPVVAIIVLDRRRGAAPCCSADLAADDVGIACCDDVALCFACGGRSGDHGVSLEHDICVVLCCRAVDVTGAYTQPTVRNDTSSQATASV